MTSMNILLLCCMAANVLTLKNIIEPQYLIILVFLNENMFYVFLESVLTNTHITRVKVFRINPEFRILRLTLNLINHLKLKLFTFVGILQVLKFVFLKFRILEILNFHP